MHCGVKRRTHGLSHVSVIVTTSARGSALLLQSGQALCTTQEEQVHSTAATCQRHSFQDSGRDHIRFIGRIQPSSGKLDEPLLAARNLSEGNSDKLACS